MNDPRITFLNPLERRCSPGYVRFGPACVKESDPALKELSPQQKAEIKAKWGSQANAILKAQQEYQAKLTGMQWKQRPKKKLIPILIGVGIVLLILRGMK